MNRYDLNNIQIEIYHETNSEFEKVRELCLEEDNWLRNNYTKENLVIEDHNGYGVVYQKSTGKPMVMGGVFNDGRYPSNVAKQINRLYTFPEFRMKHTDMTDGFRVTCSLIDALEKINNYDVYLITMQNRPRGGKRWWDVWCKHIGIASNQKWTPGAGYIKTCPHDVQKCRQNFVYCETQIGSYATWSPKTITHTEWMAMPEGK